MSNIKYQFVCQDFVYTFPMTTTKNTHSQCQNTLPMSSTKNTHSQCQNTLPMSTTTKYNAQHNFLNVFPTSSYWNMA